MAQTAEEIRDRAGDIVERAEFSPPSPSLRERVGEWLAERLGDLIGSFVGGGFGSVFAWAFLIGAVLLIAWVLTRLRSVRPMPPTQSAHVETEVVEDLSAAQWMARAREAMAAHDWREAVRCHYRALVAELSERNLLDEGVGTTTGEARALYESVPFAQAADVFDLAWYSDQPQTRASADEIERLADEVWSRGAKTHDGVPEPRDHAS